MLWFRAVVRTQATNSNRDFLYHFDKASQSISQFWYIDNIVVFRNSSVVVVSRSSLRPNHHVNVYSLNRADPGSCIKPRELRIFSLNSLPVQTRDDLTRYVEHWEYAFLACRVCVPCMQRYRQKVQSGYFK